MAIDKNNFYYFAYGSNMNHKQMQSIGKERDVGEMVHN